MKKFAAILLCAAMLMIGMVAQAETGYTIVQGYLDSDNCPDVTQVYSQTLDSDSESKSLALVFNFSNSSIILIGDNWQGHTEATAWVADTAYAFAETLVTFCNDWDSVEEVLDEGYTFSVWLIMDDAESPIIIHSKEEADAVIEALKSALED